MFQTNWSVPSHANSFRLDYQAIALNFEYTKTNAPHRGAFEEGESGDDLLSRAESLLSLALGRFTVLFGMGRGGTAPLWSPDITVCFPGLTRKAELGLRFSSGDSAMDCGIGFKAQAEEEVCIETGIDCP
jgi:hypothetical protein